MSETIIGGIVEPTPVEKKKTGNFFSRLFSSKKKKNKEQEENNSLPASKESEVPVIVELTKQEARDKAKSIINQKFVVGKTYMYRHKGVCGSRDIVKKYILKKKIYSSRGVILNILIMKQIEGPMDKIFTLPRDDCKRFHIKYEPGLQVHSMVNNWIPCK